MPRIRTLIVDDSALVRKVVTESLAHDPEIEVVGTAVDPYIARDKILALNPDVITLDIEMPRMDGLTFLKLLMKHRPMPVIVMSSLTATGSDKALEALQAGAVDVIGKPGSSFSAVDGTLLAARIKAAAHSRYRRHQPGETHTSFVNRRPAATETPPATTDPATTVARPTPPLDPQNTGQTTFIQRTAALHSAPAPRVAVAPLLGQPQIKPSMAEHARHYHPRQIILLGASTGGTEALKAVLTRLTADLPGMCIVQHIPGYFSKAFADRLNHLCRIEVREAQAGDRLRPGLALVAPGGYHLVLRWVGNTYSVDLNEGPLIHHQRPAVDVLYDSAVKAGAAPHSLAVLLTGMGSDGAAGMLKLKTAGALTIAQNEESCVVFGMPREAIRMGAAQHVLHLDQMAARIERYASEVCLEHATAGSPH